MCKGHYGYYYQCPNCVNYFWHEWHIVNLSDWGHELDDTNLHVVSEDCNYWGVKHHRLHVFRDPFKPRCILCPECKDPRLTPLATRRRFATLQYRAPVRPTGYPVPEEWADINRVEEPELYVLSEFEMAEIFGDAWTDGGDEYNYQDSSDIHETSGASERFDMTALEHEIDTTVDQDAYPQITIDEAESNEEYEVDDEHANGGSSPHSAITVIHSAQDLQPAEWPEDTVQPMETLWAYGSAQLNALPEHYLEMAEPEQVATFWHDAADDPEFQEWLTEEH